MTDGPIFIDCFSTDIYDMKRKDQRDPLKVLAVLARAGKFSCFEASDNQTIARTITDLMRGPLIERYTPETRLCISQTISPELL